MIGAAAARFDPEVEAALLARYGVDTLDPTVTNRRVFVLLQRLPGEYLLDPIDWDTDRHLLATIADALHNLLWVTVKVNSKKGASVPKISPIPRPGTVSEPEKPATLADLATLLVREGMVTT